MTVTSSDGLLEGWGAQKSRVITWHDPAPTAAIGASMDGLDFVRAVMERRIPTPPFDQLMQFNIVSVESGKVVFTVRPTSRRTTPSVLFKAVSSVHFWTTRWALRCTARCHRARVSPQSKSR